MVSTVEEFLIKKEEIDLLFSEKEKLSAPFADVKKSRVKEYASKIAKLAGFLFIIGDENNINELKVYSDITETQLLSGSLQFLFSNSQKVLDIAKDHLVGKSLDEHGLSKEDFGLFRNKRVEIWFDQDFAGQKSAYGTKTITAQLSSKELTHYSLLMKYEN